MLSDNQIDDLCCEWLYVAPGRTYEEHRPFARAIESAACAERDARIAELERLRSEDHSHALDLAAEIERLTQQLDVMAKNTEAQAHASVMREIELEDKAKKLERELEEARKDAELLDWLDNNIFAKDPDDWDQKYGRCRNGKTQMWAIFAPKGVQGSARRIVDAAIKEQT